MTKSVDDKRLVHLLMDKSSGLTIAANGEPVKDQKIITGPVTVRYSGPDFKDAKDRDLGDLAIFERAPAEANAYLRGSTITERTIMCGDSYTTVVYFQINIKQAEMYGQPIRRARPFVEPSQIPDGEAD